MANLLGRFLFPIKEEEVVPDAPDVTVPEKIIVPINARYKFEGTFELEGYAAGDTIEVVDGTSVNYKLQGTISGVRLANETGTKGGLLSLREHGQGFSTDFHSGTRAVNVYMNSLPFSQTIDFRGQLRFSYHTANSATGSVYFTLRFNFNREVYVEGELLAERYNYKITRE